MTEPLAPVVTASAAAGNLVNTTLTTILAMSRTQAGAINTLQQVATHSLPIGVTIPDDANRISAKSYFAHSKRYTVHVDKEKLGQLEYFRNKDKAKKFRKLQGTYEQILFSGNSAFEVHVTRAVGSDGRPHVERLTAVPAATVDLPKMWTEDTSVLQAVALWKPDGSCTGMRISFSMNHKGAMTHLSGSQTSTMTIWADGSVTGGHGPVFHGHEATLTTGAPEPSRTVVELLKKKLADQTKAKLERKKLTKENLEAIRLEYQPKIDSWLGADRESIKGVWTEEQNDRLLKDLATGELQLKKEVIFDAIAERTLDGRMRYCTAAAAAWRDTYEAKLGDQPGEHQLRALAEFVDKCVEYIRQACRAGLPDEELKTTLDERSVRFERLTLGPDRGDSVLTSSSDSN